MPASAAEKTKVGGEILIDNLLSALNAVRTQSWEDFGVIEETVRETRGANPLEYHPLDMLHITNLLGMILPVYEAKRKQYEADPDTRKREVDDVRHVLREYKQHMDALQAAITGINQWRITPDEVDRYVQAVSAASLFLYQEEKNIPETKRGEMRFAIGRVRVGLPSRADYSVLFRR